MKITFFGDVMCEPPITKASKKKDGSYNFDGVFERVRPMFEESDYVITNMEFPLAGEDAKYTDNFFVFNAPDESAKSIKNAGVDLVSTVNNHTFDRGLQGMLRTIRALDEIGLPHTGTYLPEKGREEADFVIFCPHVGGQFNSKPGKFSEYVIEQAVKAGADAVMASHLYIEDKKNSKVTFSILKGVEKRGKQLVSWPVDELYKTLKTKNQKEKLKNI